jgi:threonine aldolase
MRQAGFLAAAGLYALEHHIGRLEEDHRRARVLGEGLAALGYTIRPVETNMVYVTVSEAQSAVDGLLAEGIKASSVSSTELRLVTHLDIDDDHVQTALAAFGKLAPSAA